MATPRVDGIDVSHHNLVSDAAAIPTLPLMSAKATEGNLFVSSTFAYFWKLFKAKGCRYRGAYHWIRSNRGTMLEQVLHLEKTLKTVGGLGVGDLIQLDWEPLRASDGTTIDPGPTVAQVEEWLELAEDRWPGRTIVYSSDWVPGFTTWRTRHPSHPVWYANYRLIDDSRGGWQESLRWGAAVWQWSSTVQVPGFAYGIDVNHVHDFATLDRLTLQTPDPPEVLMKIKRPPVGAPDWWPWIGLFDNGTARQLVSDDIDITWGAPQAHLEEGQYRRLAVSIGCDLANPLPDGSKADVTVTVPPVDVPAFPTSWTVMAA